MKTKKVEMIDENDVKLCMVLQQFGFSNNAAKVLLYLLHNKQGMSRNIEQTVDLRQPEVSMGIKELYDMKLLDTKKIMRKGKGRPTHQYVLKLSFSEMKKLIHKRGEEQMEEIRKNMEKINQLFVNLEK